MATSYDEAIEKAWEIGREHGENAAAWWEQETRVFLSSPPNAAMMLAGLDDGDPLVLDNLPTPDLSGEWADGYTPTRLAEDCGLTPDQVMASWDADLVTVDTLLCDAYELAFSEAVETAVRAACESALSE